MREILEDNVDDVVTDGRRKVTAGAAAGPPKHPHARPRGAGSPEAAAAGRV